MSNGYSFSGINNISSSYVAGMKETAKQLMGEKDTISINEAKSIFEKANININANMLEKMAGADGKIDVNTAEMGAFLTTLDGKLDTEINKFKFDDYIEDKSEKGGDLEGAIQTEGTSSEIDTILNKFGIGPNNQASQKDPSGDSGVFNMPQGTRYAVFSSECAKATY